MRRCSQILALIGCLPAALFAAGLEESEAFVRARQALADGLPEVAAVKAGRLLQNKAWTMDEVRTLATFAAEAWIRTGKTAEVLALAEAHDL